MFYVGEACQVLFNDTLGWVDCVVLYIGGPLLISVNRQSDYIIEVPGIVNFNIHANTRGDKYYLGNPFAWGVFHEQLRKKPPKNEPVGWEEVQSIIGWNPKTVIEVTNNE